MLAGNRNMHLQMFIFGLSFQRLYSFLTPGMASFQHRSISQNNWYIQHTNSGEFIRPISSLSSRKLSTSIKSKDSDSEDNSGHKSNSAAPVLSPEDDQLLQKFRTHQANAAKISIAEEIRTLIENSIGYGVLSTNSIQFSGFPTGSVVGFSLDDQGKPFFVFSTMSAHTSDIIADGRVSLTVTANDFKGAADGRVVLIGKVSRLSSDLQASYREKYVARHKDAFWIDFGDFSYFLMDSIEYVRYVGGFARAGGITGVEYLAAKPDPLAPFAGRVLSHMNDDHADSITAMVQHYVGVPTKDAKIVSLDRLGMTVLATIKIASGGSAKIRVPFPREVTDRKAIKDVLVEMTKESEAAAASP